jgi:hypothetical protein
MNSEEIVFQLYKLHSKQKENFVDRSFVTNKFYLLLILSLIVIMFLMKDYSFIHGLSLILIFSAAGMAICVMWWINVDSYNFLIKVKLKHVLEEIEKKFPIQPYFQEITAIRDLRKNKKEFLFADIQKLLAIVFLLLFFVLFANEVLVLIIN